MIKRSGRGGGLSRRRGDLLFWAKRTREGSNMFFGLSAIFAATGGVSLNRSGSKAVMALMAVMERWLTDGPANEEKWRRGGQHLNVLDDGAATQSQALQVCVNSSVPNSCQLIFKFRDFFLFHFLCVRILTKESRENNCKEIWFFSSFSPASSCL